MDVGMMVDERLSSVFGIAGIEGLWRGRTVEAFGWIQKCPLSGGVVLPRSK